MSAADDEQHGHYGQEHRLERLAFFSDAVFAIAITILVVDIHVPQLGNNASNMDWVRALLALAPNFGAYALSFVVIGMLCIATRNHWASGSQSWAG